MYKLATRGKLHLLEKTEDEVLHILSKLKTESDTPDSLARKANEVVLLQPNFFGIGIDVNKLLKRLFPRVFPKDN